MGYRGRCLGEHILYDVCSIHHNIGSVETRLKTYYALKGNLETMWLELDEHERLSSHRGLVLEDIVHVKYFPVAPALTVIVNQLSTNITGDKDKRHVSIRLTQDYTGFHYPCAANYFYNFLRMDIRVSNGQKPIYQMYYTMAACLREGVKDKFPGSFLKKYRAEFAQIMNREICVEALQQGTLFCDLYVPALGGWQPGI
jgi:hypothetical protein